MQQYHINKWNAIIIFLTYSIADEKYMIVDNNVSIKVLYFIVSICLTLKNFLDFRTLYSLFLHRIDNLHGSNQGLSFLIKYDRCHKEMVNQFQLRLSTVLIYGGDPIDDGV